jgi:hypothetical protein
MPRRPAAESRSYGQSYGASPRPPPADGRVELVRRRERLQARAGPFGSHLARIAPASCASAGSHRRSHVARQRTAPGSAASAGSSSEPSPGYTSSSGCSSATTAATTSTKPSLDSAAASSATGDSKTHCDSISKYRLDSSGTADQLYLSANAVRPHTRALYRKLGVSTRADAVARGPSSASSSKPNHVCDSSMGAAGVSRTG